ncbi:hypothetical protein JL108_18275 [Aeromicrobium sp. YIM 150415]|uniref:hypothetical protein n=1 Tax=Aeromicrobium sp. YIM 150415 TaxID=2803912 RepID=UPI001962CDC7|nr:hypothetical protein [Aeromicrobium sp. YIM 150415]MBM9465401.1 hypothetical protein [Aeromicrobium sp. YIM 150415]
MTALSFDEALRSTSEADLLSSLPAYQASVVSAMLASRPPEEVAKAWLESSGQSDTAPFGGMKKTGERLVQNTLIEMQNLLCSDSGYEEERAQLKESLGAGKVFSAGVIATVLSPHIGIAATVLAPAVVLILIVATRAGQKTLCQSLADTLGAVESASNAPNDRAEP